MPTVFSPRTFTHQIDSVRLAVIDLVPFFDPVIAENGENVWVSRINVPRPYRRRGIAAELLALAIAHTAMQGRDLFLCALSSDDNFHNLDLTAWYIRCGFKHFGDVFPERITPAVDSSYAKGLLVRRFRGEKRL